MRAARLGVAAAVAVLVVGLMIQAQPRVGPGASASPAASTVAARPTPPATRPAKGSPQPTATAEPWTDLAVPAFEPVAQLTAAQPLGTRVAVTSAFTLRSLAGTSATELAGRLSVAPEIDFTVQAGAAADAAVIRPAATLAEGTRYRFQLRNADGSLVDSWAFVTAGPLHVVEQLPAHQARDVPVSTGIEVTFDQPASDGFRTHFSIQPSVAGRFEQHGRTWVFVPDRPLEPETAYRVTIASGLRAADSAETLEREVSYSFITARAELAEPRVRFARAMIEIRPRGQLVIALSVEPGANEEYPATLPVEIHRFPSSAAVVDAARALARIERWAYDTFPGSVALEGLQRVAKVDAPLYQTDSGHVIHVPAQLDAGAYLVTVPRAAQAPQLVLQVGDLSAYTLTSDTQTLAWVNDLATGRGLAGASVTTASGLALGKTNADGLLVVGTPAELRQETDDDWYGGPPSLLTITLGGRQLVVAPGIDTGWQYPYEDNRASTIPDPLSDWWSFFTTDRTDYRQTDTVRAWGVVRSRDDRSVPDGIELRLRPADSDDAAALATIPAVGSSRGVFTAEVPLSELPMGGYTLELYVGAVKLTSLWLNVTEIRKPAYRIEVTTARRAYVVGETLQASVAVTFYDGTPVAGMDLKVGLRDNEVAIRTDASGRATASLEVPFREDTPYATYENVAAHPVSAEEGEISGEASVWVLPASIRIEAKSTLVNGTLRVRGTVEAVDRDALEALLRGGGDPGDPAGTPVRGTTVRATVIHHVSTTKVVGTTYDYIEKRVVPRYESTTTDKVLTSRSLTTSTTGSFELTLVVPAPKDAYDVKLSARDRDGRTFDWQEWVSDQSDWAVSNAPYLSPGTACCDDWLRYGVGELVKLTMRAANDAALPDGRFLFITADRGIRRVVLQASGTISRTFAEADLPGYTVRAIQAASTGYTVADATVRVRAEDKTLKVRLKADRDRYAPGDTATVDVYTTDPAGAPVSTDVVVHGVDQKLEDMGTTGMGDPLGWLLAVPGAGFLQSYASHAAPWPGGDGGGGVGGGRADFQDVIVFQRLATDAAGHARITFRLSDDLTSWRVSAMAVSSNLDAGVGSVLIPVGLPFFVDAVLAPEFLAGERPVLRVRAFGLGLRTGDLVRFTVESADIGLKPTLVEGRAFEAVGVPLLALPLGTHELAISASATSAGTTLRDALVRRVRVVPTRLMALASSYEPLTAGHTPPGGTGLTTYVVTDAGRGALIAILEELASSATSRLDRALAAETARRLLIDEFGFAEGDLPASRWDGAPYRREGGFALLPWASVDLALSARVALVAPREIGGDQFRYELRIEEGETRNRERQIIALVGLAALGEQVLDELRSLDLPTLSVSERLWLALGLAASGDAAAARRIEREILEESGQRLGPWVRVAGAVEAETMDRTGLMLLLAARLGDPLAADISRYLREHPSSEQIVPLEQVGHVQAALERLPRVATTFAWSLDGKRQVVTLEAGRSFTLVLTESQRRTFSLEPIAGQATVASVWSRTAADLPSDPGVTISRTVAPVNGAPADATVRVTLSFGFQSQAPTGCYEITDLVPSGLAPVSSSPEYWQREEGAVLPPSEVRGQRVSWCVTPKDKMRTLTYLARVVSPGTYVWEPAIIQSALAPTIAARTAAGEYTIR